jgi:uncharacterized membrane protein YgaE (UPF0421/DUF939 family)
MKNIFDRSTLALSAFFFYMVNILAFVNEPPWHIKAVIIAVFSISGSRIPSARSIFQRLQFQLA